MIGRYAALVPLRGGSKSIPLKNIKTFAGKPLCIWCLEAALSTPAIGTVWASTDSDAIADVVRTQAPGVLIHRRPEALAGDLATTEAVMVDWIQNASIHTPKVVTLQATSPQTTAEDLSTAVATLEAAGADSLVTGVRTHRFFWTDEGRPLNYDPEARPMRQQWSGTFMENGAFYISRRDRLLAGESRLHGRIAMHLMGELASIELDELSDWPRLEDEFRKRGMA